VEKDEGAARATMGRKSMAIIKYLQTFIFDTEEGLDTQFKGETAGR
jgi:hypothetical protein